MPPSTTTTGAVLESMILPALKRGGYTYEKQVHIGQRPGGGRHFVDVLARKKGRQFLISLKWQQVSGTAEQKVPFEVISLIEAILHLETTAPPADSVSAYLVLGGPGWTLRDFFASGALKKHLVFADRVDILNLESFVAKANSGEL